MRLQLSLGKLVGLVLVAGLVLAFGSHLQEPAVVYYVGIAGGAIGISIGRRYSRHILADVACGSLGGAIAGGTVLLTLVFIDPNSTLSDVGFGVARIFVYLGGGGGLTATAGAKLLGL